MIQCEVPHMPEVPKSTRELLFANIASQKSAPENQEQSYSSHGITKFDIDTEDRDTSEAMMFEALLRF